MKRISKQEIYGNKIRETFPVGLKFKVEHPETFKLVEATVTHYVTDPQTFHNYPVGIAYQLDTGETDYIDAGFLFEADPLRN